MGRLTRRPIDFPCPVAGQLLQWIALRSVKNLSHFSGWYSSSCDFLLFQVLFVQPFHAQVALGAPLGSGDLAQSCSYAP